MLNESESFTLDTQSLEPPASLGDLPLIVLSRGMQEGDSPEEQRIRDELQRELAALSTNGRQIVVRESGHGIQHDLPELLSASVEELVNLVRETGR